MAFRVLLKNDGTQVLQQSYLGWERIGEKLIAMPKWEDVRILTEQQAAEEQQKSLDEIRGHINERAS